VPKRILSSHSFFPVGKEQSKELQLGARRAFSVEHIAKPFLEEAPDEKESAEVFVCFCDPGYVWPAGFWAGINDRIYLWYGYRPQWGYRT